MIIAGLMTGTSADALDIALVDLDVQEDADGDDLVLTLLAHRELAFPDDLGRDILRLIEPAPVPLSLLTSVDSRLGVLSAQAVQAVCSEVGVDCDLVVSHGQTVQHLIDGGTVLGTLQIGQPAWIAEGTGFAVLSDVRARDVAAGGQGAPLVGLLDALILGGADRPVAALNLGGIANLTVVAPGSEPVAFDTGPANALIDVMARRITGDQRAIDRDGAFAAQGKVVPALLDDLLTEPYYSLAPPKSTGKELFHAAYLDAVLGRHPGLDPYDVTATVTALTAHTVAAECRRLGVTRVSASGGGTHNPVLMGELARALGPDVPLGLTGELGVSEKAKEAILMAVIGWFTWHGLPATMPSCTGARHPSVAGRLTPGARPLALPPPRSRTPRRLRAVTT